MSVGAKHRECGNQARRLPIVALAFVVVAACQAPTSNAPVSRPGGIATTKLSPLPSGVTGTSVLIPSAPPSTLSSVSPSPVTSTSPNVVIVVSPSNAPVSASPALAPVSAPPSTLTASGSPSLVSTPTPSPTPLRYELTTLAGGSNGSTEQELSGDLVTLSAFEDEIGMALAPVATNPDVTGLYFSDGLQNRIRKATLADSLATVSMFAGMQNGSLSQPCGVIFDPVTRCLYVADTFNYRVARVGLAGNTVGLAEGAIDSLIEGANVGAPVYREGDGRGSSPTARLGNPAGLALVGRQLFVSDFFFHNISRIDLSVDNFPITFVAGSKTEEPGLPSESPVPGAEARFSFPVALCHGVRNGQPRVIIADRFNHCLRALNPESGEVSWLAGSKTGAKGTMDGPADVARFDEPLAVALDGNGNVYIGERNSARIRRLSAAGEVSTCVGNTPGYSNGVGDAAKLGAAVGLAVLNKPDGSLDTLYVYDVGTVGTGGTNAPRLRQMRVSTAP